jgi:putative lipoprotein (rSAM/lipoprotein system)
MNRRTKFELNEVKTKLLKTQNVIIAKILTLLGFTAFVSCGMEKYGVPHTEYKVMGKVSSKETQQPIENIQVSTRQWNQIYTDENGNYQIWHDDRDALIQFRDTANNYNDLDTLIKFEGRVDQKTINVQLTPKENEN